MFITKCVKQNEAGELLASEKISNLDFELSFAVRCYPRKAKASNNSEVAGFLSLGQSPQIQVSERDVLDEKLLENIAEKEQQEEPHHLEEDFSPVAQLVELGRRQGYVTIDDVLKFFPEAEKVKLSTIF